MKLCAGAALVAGFLVGREALADVCTWDGSDASANWTTIANWTDCGGSYPAAGDTAVFSGTSGTALDPVTVDTSVTIGALVIHSGYTGTITISSGVTLTVSNDVGITDRLVAWWRLDESSGSTYADASGYGFDMTDVGDPTVSTGAACAPSDFYTAGCLNFAPPDYLHLGSLPKPFQPTDEQWTISAYVDLDNVDNDDQGCGGSGGFGADVLNLGNNLQIRMCADASTGGAAVYPRMVFRYGASSYQHCEYDASSLTLGGAGGYVVGTFNGSNCVVYLNGTSDTTATTNDLLIGGDSEVAIGSHSNLAGYSIDGRIDDVRYWNRALSSAEVSALSGGGIYPFISAVQTFDGTGNLNIGGDLTIHARSVDFDTVNVTVSGNIVNMGGRTTGSTVMSLGEAPARQLVAWVVRCTA